jgi:predicted  nucleic acid-binding Zn-ribbon protein
MEIKLIDGIFTIEEAEMLLTAIFKTKIAFHEQKIKTIHDSEEDIEHSEKRIIQLEQTLRDAIRKMREKGQTHTSLNAHIEVNTTQQLTL